MKKTANRKPGKPHPLAQSVALNALWGVAFIVVWLIAGIGIYRGSGLCAESVSRSFECAAMIAAGMGPVVEIHDDAAASFLVGLYAVLSMIVGFVVPSLVLAPLFHRVLKSIHLDAQDGG